MTITDRKMGRHAVADVFDDVALEWRLLCAIVHRPAGRLFVSPFRASLNPTGVP